MKGEPQGKATFAQKTLHIFLCVETRKFVPVLYIWVNYIEVLWNTLP